jgi:transmembrane sensor
MKLNSSDTRSVLAERWAGVALAAVLLTTGVIAVHPDSHDGFEAYTTRTGETRSVALGDGSQVHLNTRTRLEWAAGSSERRAVLREGEAFFEVKPDPQRPFRVELAGSEIQVLGTSFDVYRKADGRVSVTVLDGKVRVEGQNGPRGIGWERELFKNQHIEYGAAGLTQDTCTSPRAPDAVEWREGKVEFDGVPLPQVVEELKRYTDRRIENRDHRLNEVQFLGALSTRDVAGALARLAKLAPVRVTEQDGALILKYRDRP